MNDNLDIIGIINSIGIFDGSFPKKSIQNAIEFGDKLEPELLQLVERTIASPKDNYSNEGWQSFIISLFLLSKLRSKAAYKQLINICKLPKEELEILLVDCLTEDLHKFLGSTFNGDLESLREIIFDERLDVFARTAAIKCYLVLLKDKIITREQVIFDFKNIFLKFNQKYSEIHANFICVCLDFHSDELIDEIYSSFKNELVDESIVRLSNVKMEFKQIKSEAFSDFKSDERYDLIKDPIEEMKWWDCWKENETEYNLTPSGSELLGVSLKHLLDSKPNMLGTGIMQKKEKIGRNDRCPCGSGLKYKKCCLSLSTQISKKIETLPNKR